MATKFSLDTLKAKMSGVSKIISDNQRVIYNVAMFGAIAFAAISAFYRYTSSQELLEKGKQTLEKTIPYGFNRLSTNSALADKYPSWATLSDVIDFSADLDSELKASTDYRTTLSIPYDNFLKFFYTPSINIWKDPFSGVIDTELVGKRYIEDNPYSDITLITNWTSFFKDVGLGNSFNTISDIKIGTIENSSQPGYFEMPIDLSFETPDKRSFLLLVNKISMTAYVKNISLMNEFVYNFWNEVSSTKEEAIKAFEEKFNTDNATKLTTDQIIGLMLYNRIKNDSLDPQNNLVDTTIINNAIKKTAECSQADSRNYCLYLFREKMRSLPYLAYGVARPGINQVDGLKLFFSNLPPLISIDNFSFTKKDTRLRRTNNDTGYKGTIRIRVYGRDVTNEEIDEISKKLGGLCFISQDALTLGAAKSKISTAIASVGEKNVNTKRSQVLNQALNYITSIEGGYEGLSNYKKVIKLFESYRTLKENNICDHISEQGASVDDFFGQSGSGEVDLLGGDSQEESSDELSGESSQSEEETSEQSSSGSVTSSGSQDILPPSDQQQTGGQDESTRQSEAISTPHTGSVSSSGLLDNQINEEGTVPAQETSSSSSTGEDMRGSQGQLVNQLEN